MKKILSIIMIVVMVISLLGVQVAAKGDGNQNPNEYKYSFQEPNEEPHMNQNGYTYQYHRAQNCYQGTYGIYLYEKENFCYTPDCDGWDIVIGGDCGLVKWSPGGFAFSGYGLELDVEYSLIIYPEPADWPNIITVLGTGTPSDIPASCNGVEYDTYLSITGPDNLYDYSGQKIWLVPSGDLSELQFNSWHPENYLFENELIP